MLDAATREFIWYREMQPILAVNGVGSQPPPGESTGFVSQ